MVYFIIFYNSLIYQKIVYITNFKSLFNSFNYEKYFLIRQKFVLFVSYFLSIF